MWAKYWKVLNDTGEAPPDEIARRAKEVAVGNEYDGMVEGARKFKSAGIAYFGSITSRLSWGPLSGDEAVIRDCMDQTKFGTYKIGTNKAVTVGTARVNLNATFKQTSDGWRVQGIYNDKASSC